MLCLALTPPSSRTLGTGSSQLGVQIMAGPGSWNPLLLRKGGFGLGVARTGILLAAEAPCRWTQQARPPAPQGPKAWIQPVCRPGLRVPTGTAGVLVTQLWRAWPPDEPGAGTLVASPTDMEQHHRTASEMFNWQQSPAASAGSEGAGAARAPARHARLQPGAKHAGLEPDR